MDTNFQIVAAKAIKVIADSMVKSTELVRARGCLQIGPERPPSLIRANAMRQIEYLANMSVAVTSRIQGMIHDRSELCNNLAPINRIPGEILSIIFAQQLPSENDFEFSPDDPSSLTNLSLVCRRWRDFVEACPTLWTTVRSSYSYPFFRKVSKNSSNLPVKLFLEGDGGWPHKDGSLLRLGNRIQSVTYCGSNITAAQAYTQSAVDFTFKYKESGGFSLIRKDALAICSGPPLRLLYVTGVHRLDLDLDRLRGLESLTLGNVKVESSGFFVQLWELLSTSSNLRYVDLLEVEAPAEPRLDVEATSLLPPRPPVTLATSCRSTSTRSSCYQPHGTPLCVTEGDYGLPLEWISQLWGPMIRQVRKINLSVHILPYRHSLGPIVNSCLDWELGADGDPVGVLSKVVQLLQDVGLGRSAAVSFTIIGPHQSWVPVRPFDVTMPILESLGEITSIETTRIEDIRPLLKRLATFEEGQSAWPCPNLRFIKATGMPKPIHEDFLIPSHPRWDILYTDTKGREDFVVFKCRDAQSTPRAFLTKVFEWSDEPVEKIEDLITFS